MLFDHSPLGFADLEIPETQPGAVGLKAHKTVLGHINGVGVRNLQNQHTIHHNKDMTVQTAALDMILSARLEGEQGRGGVE